MRVNWGCQTLYHPTGQRIGLVVRADAPVPGWWSTRANAGDFCLQDGHGSKLAPGKLVKGLFDTIDRGISRIIGGPPPSVPSSAADSFAFRPSESGDHFGSESSRSGYSTGPRSGAPMAPSASIAASMERLPPEPNRGPPRSQSEPDFGRNAKQVPFTWHSKRFFVDYESDCNL